MLERIEKVNPAINAFCLVDADAALASARESEARWQRGEPIGPLDGVPTSIKDLILTRGWPTLPRQLHRRSRSALGRRRAGDGPAPRGRSSARRQDDDARVRVQGRDELTDDRHHPQSVGHDEDEWGIVGWHCRRRGRGLGAAQHRKRRRRIGADPGRVLRELRSQAELRSRACLSTLAVRHGLPPRPAHDERRRRGAHDERAEATRSRATGRRFLPTTPTTSRTSTRASTDFGCCSRQHSAMRTVHPEVAAAVAPRREAA